MDHPGCFVVQEGSTVSGLGPLALQVLGLGVVWTSLHCSGMCGPLIAGLRFGVRGQALHPARAAVDLCAYQCGRAVVYAAMGACAGALGMVVSASLHRWTPIITLAVAVSFVVTALWRLRKAVSVSGPPSRLAQWSGAIFSRWAEHPLRRAAALGMVLAFMPCLLLFWVLSLAAASGSPLDGAIVMVLLVLLTVPVLLAAAVLPAVVGRWRRFCAPWIGPSAMLVSAVWMTMIGLAGLDVIPHAHLRWGDYMIMFW